MPKKLLQAAATPTLIQERLDIWGRCIRTQRVAQGIPARDLCARMGISDATLRRLEQGDPGAGAATYLSALMILGVLDHAAPVPDRILWSASPRSRARADRSEKDNEHF